MCTQDASDCSFQEGRVNTSEVSLRACTHESAGKHRRARVFKHSHTKRRRLGRNRNAFTSIISRAHTHTQVCITGIVMPRVQLGPVHHLSVGMCLYEWMVLWVAQQQLLYSKQRWIYSLLNKSGWMSMQMEAHATVPNVIFAWKPSSICELTRFHSPSVLICNSHCLAHKHGNSPWQTQINFCAFRKLHLTPGHINIGFVSISGRSLLIICMHGWLRWRLIQIVFSNFSLLLVVFPLLFFSLSSPSMC